MIFKELDPILAQKAVEGYQNELLPETKSLEAYYRQFRCLRCKGTCRKETVRSHAFSDPNTLVPRSCLRCHDCNMLFDPHTALILERGDAADVPDMP